MDEPTNVFLALIIIGLPVMLLMLIANRYFRLREKKLEVEAGLAAEKAAQYASRSHELEARLKVLEQIVTDGGAQTAAQIEALRDHARIESRGDDSMNQFEMVAIIVVAVMLASVLRAKYGHRRNKGDSNDRREEAENLRLRDEVRELKERLKVLERITVDKENSLARQIDELRDR